MVGQFTLTAQETDVAGNVSTASATYTVDPHVPVVTLQNTSAANGAPTKNLAFTGTADAYSTVYFYDSLTGETGQNNFSYANQGEEIGSTTAGANGDYSFAAPGNLSYGGDSYISAVEPYDNGTLGSDTFALSYYPFVVTTGAAAFAEPSLQTDDGVSTIDIAYSVNNAPDEDGIPDAETLTFTDSQGNQLTLSGADLGSGLAAPTGLVNGLVSYSLTLTDAVGDSATPVSGSFILNATIPAPAILTQGVDTNVVDHTLYGGDTAADAGQQVSIYQIYDDATTYYGRAFVNADGSWSLPVALSSGDGVYGYEAQVTATDGVARSTTAASAFDLSATPPTFTFSALDNSSEIVGVNASGEATCLTNNAAIEIQTSEAATVTVYNNGVAILTAYDTPANPTVFELAGDGTYNLTASATDVYGNSEDSADEGLGGEISVILKATPPAAPTLSLQNDTGGGDDTTDLTILGQVDPADDVSLTEVNPDGSTEPVTLTDTINLTVYTSDGQTEQATLTADANGQFSFTPTTTHDGTMQIVATATDAAGKTSLQSTFTYTADVVQPTVSVALADDTGSSGSDLLTNDPTLRVTTSKTDVTVTFFDGSTLLGSASTGVGDLTGFTPTGLADGPQTITAQATDAAGLAGPAQAFSFVLQTSANPTGALDLVTTGLGDDIYAYSVTDGATALASANVVFSDGYGHQATGQSSDGGLDGVVTLSGFIGAISEAVSVTDMADNTASVTDPLFTLALENDDGLAPGALVASAPRLDGVAGPNATVTLSDQQGVIAAGSADSSGAYQFEPTLANGQYVLTASTTDALGNVDTDQLQLTIFDTPTPDASISINAPAGNVTSHQFEVTGEASASEAGNLVYLFAPDYAVQNFPYESLVGYGTVQANGAWQVAVSVADDATYSYEAEVVSDDAQRTMSAPQAFVVDTAPPNPITITDGDAVVAGDDYVLTGTSDLDDGYIQIETPANGEYTLFQTDASGNWSYDIPVAAAPEYINGIFAAVVLPPDSTTTIKVSLAYTSNFSPVSPASAETTLTASAGPTPPTVTISSVGGAVGSAQQTISGTVDVTDAGLTVTIFDGTIAIGSAPSDPVTGAWSASVALLNQGVNAISAQATDSAGKTGTSAVVDFETPVTVAEFLADQVALDAAQPSGFAIADTTAHVLAKLGALGEDTNLSAITLTSGALTATVAEFAADRIALDKVVGGFAVADTAANVQADLANLLADAHVTTIRSNDPGGGFEIAHYGVTGAAYTSYTVQFASNGQVASVTYNNGTTGTYSYNPDGSYQIANADVAGKATRATSSRATRMGRSTTSPIPASLAKPIRPTMSSTAPTQSRPRRATRTG